MKISLIQMSSNDNKKQNEHKAISLINECLNESPDIICLSEKFLYWGEEPKYEIVDYTELEKYQQIAKEKNVNIVLGSVALNSNVKGKTTNTCFVINREGKIICKYDKKYMYKADRDDFHVDELDRTIPGDSLGIFTIDGVTMGVGICFDLRFPEYFRELTKEGAKVIFLPSHFRKNTGEIAWDILTSARAIENQVYFCACNQTGAGLCGKTKVVSYDGKILKELGEEEGILTLELDLDGQEQFRKEFPVLEQI